MFGRKKQPASTHRSPWQPAPLAFTPQPHLKARRTVTLVQGEVGVAAAPLSLIKANGVSFEKKVSAAVRAQMDAGVGGIKWDVIFLYDASGSMDSLFKDGTVQEVTDRVMAWVAGVDADGMAPVGSFGSDHQWAGEVDLTNCMGIAAREGWRTRGSTAMHLSMEAAFDVAKEADNPVLVVLLTDGSPDVKQAVIKIVCESSEYPIFWKYVLIGHDSSGLAFAQQLDDMEDHSPGARLFDNVDAQHVVNPRKISDEDFAAMMCEELASALGQMRTQGLVR